MTRTRKKGETGIKANCDFCGAEFTKTYARHRFCTTQCQRKHFTKLQKERKKEKKENVMAVCAFCGKEFTPYNSYQKYCSESCYDSSVAVTRKERNSFLRNAQTTNKKNAQDVISVRYFTWGTIQRMKVAIFDNPNWENLKSPKHEDMVLLERELDYIAMQFQKENMTATMVPCFER
jgi:hypothetical protein